MTSDQVKDMIDTFYLAKRILDLMPELPQGVLPSYIRYLEAIIELQKENAQVKISDVAKYLNLPRPGVTRTLHTMEEKGYVKKATSSLDGRVMYLTLTKSGQEIFNKFNKEYFNDLAHQLDDLDLNDVECMKKIIKQFYHVMVERGGK